MDPRHPEQAISRMRELMQQYDRIENDMKTAVVSAQLGALEREASLVIQEICLVAPRLHEAMMQVSRQRRRDLSRGNVYEQMREYAATAERVDEPVENYVDIIGEENIGGESKSVNEKPKKKTNKKKAAKKKAE